MFHRTGGKLLHAFMALGKSDLVVLCEFPDDTSAAALSLVVGAAGSVTNGATTKGFDPAGQPREVFLVAGKAGSNLNALLADAAVAGRAMGVGRQRKRGESGNFAPVSTVSLGCARYGGCRVFFAAQGVALARLRRATRL